MAELTAVERFPVQSWMKNEATQRVMNILNADEEIKALFVGGCVRNALLGEEVEDIDIATVFEPEAVIALLGRQGIKTIPTGIDHGTVTAVIGEQHFEITTLRKDVETDGRRAVIAYTTDWREDAQRRDFTMNTLLCDLEGNIYDPTGQGLADLKARRVVFVGQARQRIKEDYLRILRFYRFHFRYGQGNMDQEALAACQDEAQGINSLSRERITQELFKIMIVEEPDKALEAMFANGILKELCFQNYDQEFLKHICTFQNRYGLTFLGSRLLALCGFEIGNAETLKKRLLIPKVLQKDMEAILGVLALADLCTDHHVRVAVYKYGRLASAQALMIELAQDRVMNGYASTALNIIQNWDIPTFPITGNDLIAQGYKPGPELGETLAVREERWVQSDFQNEGGP